MKRVLIIEDEADIREVAQATLELSMGWEVLTAASGAAGVETAAAEKPDAVILDVMMPEMDGPTTFRRLEERPDTREIPVVFLTAKTQAADRERLEGLGAAGVVAKPFDPMTLGRQIAGILGWSPEG